MGENQIKSTPSQIQAFIKQHEDERGVFNPKTVITPVTVFLPYKTVGGNTTQD